MIPTLLRLCVIGELVLVACVLGDPDLACEEDSATTVGGNTVGFGNSTPVVGSWSFKGYQ